MGSSDRFGNLVRRLNPAFAGFLLVLFVASTQAADYIPRGQPIPQTIRWVNATTTGANTTATASWDTTVSKFPVAMNSSTLGKLAKGALRRAGAAAVAYQVLKGLVDGAGWLIDDLTHQVMDGPTVGPVPPGGTWWRDSITGKYFSSAAATGASMATVYGGTFQSYFCGATDGGVTICTARIQLPAGNILLAGMTTGTNNGTTSLPVNDRQPQEVTDTQLGDLVKHSPQVVNAVLIDPVTGAPIRTQELTDALNNLRRALEAANGLDPGVDLLPDETLGEETTPAQTDWPGFCDWATTVCDFIDWVKADDTETEPPEVPWEQEEVVQQEWSSGLGGGSCPGPIAIPISIGGVAADISWEYTPLCQAATWIRQVAVPLCVLLAVFIVGGYRRSASA